MLEYAKKYEAELQSLFRDITFDMFYQFEQFAVYRDDFELPKSTWDSHYFVSRYENEILGIISYQIKRVENAAYRLRINRFGDQEKRIENQYIFGKDVMIAIKDIFEKFKFRKLSFSVVVGSPIEATYDRLIERYGGRVVGINRQEVKLLDGNFYDVKDYELFAEEFYKSGSSTI